MFRANDDIRDFYIWLTDLCDGTFCGQHDHDKCERIDLESGEIKESRNRPPRVDCHACMKRLRKELGL